MKYRSRANPRVTIEAMRLPAIDEDPSEELIAWIDTLDNTERTRTLSGRHGSIDFISKPGEDESDGEWTNVAPGEWLLKDANDFVSKATHEEFEAEWEPLE